MSQRISVTGHTSVDYLLAVEKMAGPNASSPVADCREYFGGGAANVAAAIACLGGDVELISPVGNDFSQIGYDKELTKFGVDLSKLYHIPDRSLSKAFVITDSCSNQTTYFYWGAAAKLCEMKPPHVSFVHMVTADCFFNAEMAQAADFVSFDPGQDLVTYQKDPLNTILKNTDILFVNRHEIRLVMEISGKSFDELKNMIGMIVVTYDKEGSILYENEIANGKCIQSKETKIKAVLAESVDPTGAGDAYKAGFLTAFVKGYPPEICCQIGSVVASFVVEKVGCQTNLPDWGKMKERYSAHFPISDLELKK
ncbi:carbohydrate kinase family protein [Methanimicrococcus blatticola]|uniref:Inosine-guanosine kinase /cytidine kinase n=1 Tax=Methanimicrococcus blatticola TaxID=91560 RepID=A0A484F6L0_9EURY|nr:carbohydrate kinase family protein [Methanimicrococcus blatticola]MBZ3934972.1 carbohydrate kinase family protein [Methanimicrococcus blatticola]MCC2508929.1 carbohydrate kinase family protein [Methanimicrococcus blatticola]TDQ71042.1 inosine-guanosine kinase /cytidine kinase [Methanimicrococcus blatticola]